jgi:beta-galactosidase
MKTKSGTINRRQSLLLGGASVLLFTQSTYAAVSKTTAYGAGHGQPFNDGWRFSKGVGDFQAEGIDDSVWRTVDLPHDWSIEDLPASDSNKQFGPFTIKAVGGTGTGFTVGGEGWYRKRFTLDPKIAPKHAELYFEGIYEESEVFINGVMAASHVHGYTPFAVDLTTHLKPGVNTIAVHVKSLGINSRWYSGSGIYRPVKLNIHTEAMRFAQWGIGVSTRRISDEGAEIDIATQIIAPATNATLRLDVHDAKGKIVASAEKAVTADDKQSLTIPAPRLWSPDSPNLYQLTAELRQGGRVIDTRTIAFGVRVVTFSAETGMEINSVATKLRGGCVHHDNGLLGAMAFADADDRRVRLLKARGYNAIRSSHNLCSESFANACDRHGMFLIEEAFDVWHVGKRIDDYGVQFEAHWKDDLTATVMSARNHPSVIMWSIGNEVPYRSSDKGLSYQWLLANEARRLDPTRPVTAGINGLNGGLVVPDADTARPGFADVPDESATVFLDVIGQNYRHHHYESDHKTFPKRITYGSESFPKDAYSIWAKMETQPYIIGDFVWTSMDYLGEAGCGAVLITAPGAMAQGVTGWPWVGAYCGDIDLIGNQKPASLARDVVWGVAPMQLVVQKPFPEGKAETATMWGWSDEFENWTWSGSENKLLVVRIYTMGDRADLYQDGKLVGSQTLTPENMGRAEFKVPYAPGTLEAVAFRGNKEISRKRLSSIGAAAGLRITPEATRVKAGRDKLAYVQIEITDARGNFTPDAIKKLTLSVSGPAELIAFGSADPIARGSYQSTSAQTYRGKALAILRPKGKGTARIAVSGEGLTASATIVNFV